MGYFIGYQCHFCGYSDPQIALGFGKDPDMEMKLYHCDNCKSVGSAWHRKGEAIRCTYCYHPGIELLDSATKVFSCPKCGEPALFYPVEGKW